jgi:hypothetical protein
LCEFYIIISGEEGIACVLSTHIGFVVMAFILGFALLELFAVFLFSFDIDSILSRLLNVYRFNKLKLKSFNFFEHE